MGAGGFRGRVAAQVLLALAAAACSTNAGRVVATPSPTPSPVDGPAAIPPGAGEPAPTIDFAVRMTPKGATGNVTLSGEGCTTEGGRGEIVLYVYNQEGTEEPVNGGAANPDGTWELPVALRSGEYRIAPECRGADGRLVVDYTPQHIKVK